MTAAVWVLIIVALAVAGGFAFGRIGWGERIADADHEERRADIAVTALARATTWLRRVRTIASSRPWWLPEPTRGRWRPIKDPGARRLVAALDDMRKRTA